MVNLPVEYTEGHADLLNIILNQGVITYDDAVLKCQILWPDQHVWNITRVNKILKIINEAISFLNQEVRLVTCQISNERCIVYVNHANDEISRAQLNYSASECEYFRTILNALLDAEKHVLPSVTCLNLAQKMVQHSLSITKAEQKINVWIRGGYLIEKDNKLYIGPRTMAEYEMYIRDQFPIVSVCKLCQGLVFYGSACQHCECLVHADCWMTYVTKTKKCPSCKNRVDEVESS